MGYAPRHAPRPATDARDDGPRHAAPQHGGHRWSSLWSALGVLAIVAMVMVVVSPAVTDGFRPDDRVPSALLTTDDGSATGDRTGAAAGTNATSAPGARSQTSPSRSQARVPSATTAAPSTLPGRSTGTPRATTPRPSATSPSPTTTRTRTPTPSSSTPAPSPSPSSTPPSSTSTTAAATQESEVLRLVNVQRAAAGCAPAHADSRLAEAARLHSQDMADHAYFDHNSQDGRTPWDRMGAAGYPAGSAENIAAGQSDAAAVMGSWMASDGHRANILNCAHIALGVGIGHGGPYGTYWTQDFGTV